MCVPGGAASLTERCPILRGSLFLSEQVLQGSLGTDGVASGCCWFLLVVGVGRTLAVWDEGHLLVYHPHLINLSPGAIPCRPMTTLCFREDPGKGEGPPKMGHADGPDPAEPDLGLYPSTPCDTHSPQESPLYNPEHKHGHL